MDEKNELNDLLLGNQKEGGKGKKFFLVATGVLLMFFVAIGAMKFFGNDDKKQPLPIGGQDQNNQAVTVAPAPSPSADKNGSANANADAKWDEIVKKLPQDAQNEATAPATQQPAPSQPAPVAIAQTPSSATTVAPAPSPTAKPQGVEIKSEQPKQTVMTPPQKTQEEIAAEQKKEADRIAKQKELEKKRAEQKAAKQKELEKKKAEEAKQQAPKAESKTAQAQNGGYYIQVGYFNDPQTISGLATKITSAGFTAKTKDGTKNDKNITKVWVGPFGTKEEADKALPKVRKQIRSDAFIVKG